MNGPNGHAHARPNPVTDQSGFDTDLHVGPTEERFSLAKVRELVTELEVPFENSAIEWRVTNTGQEGKRGQIVPYADPRAYTDRLNALFTPAGWTRKYSIHTSASFERTQDQKIGAKVALPKFFQQLPNQGHATHDHSDEKRQVGAEARKVQEKLQDKVQSYCN